MKLTKVALINFRQYKNVDFELSGEGSDFIIVSGANGNGKTNFLNALSWCLYGDENFKATENKDLSIANRDTLSGASESEEIEVKVRVDLEMADGTSATVTRNALFKKQGYSAISIAPSKLSVTLLSDISVGSSSLPNPDVWIQQNLPRRLEPYVLFDGERLENFFKRESAKTVQAAVLEIAQVDVLRNMNSHIEVAIEKLRKSAASQDSSFEITEATERVENFESRLLTARDKRDSITSELEELNSRFGGIEEVLERENKHSREVEQERILREKITDQEQEESDAWARFAEWSGKHFPPVFAHEAISIALQEIDRRHQKGELPPPIKESVLENLLEAGTCVCGTNLKENHEGHAQINALLLKNRTLGQLGLILQGIEPHLNEWISKMRSSSEIKEFLLGKIRSLRDSLAEDRIKYQALRASLEESASQSGSLPLQDLQQILNSKDVANRELGRVQEEISSLEKDLIVAKKEQERLLSKSQKSQTQFKKLAFAQEALRESQRIFKELSDEVRLEVQRQLDAQFKKMIWKENYIDRVEIDDDFIVTVWDKNGFEILSTLSAGERESLAFAFSLALNGISNYELPMVIDSPFGRMSSEPRPKVAKALAENTMATESRESRQVILLMTDTEYDEAVREALQIREPKHFGLQFEQKNSTVKVEGA